MVTSVGPGIGKTTLAAGLVARARKAGLHAELFEEGEIFTRPAFSSVGRAFRDRGTCPTAAMMVDAYAAFVGEIDPNGAFVFDWSCLGMISDLPWAEGRPDVLLRHARDVFELAQPLRPALLHLAGDIEVALARAAAERGERWVRRYAQLAAADRPTTRARLAAIAEWIQRQPDLKLELDAFRAAGWPVSEIDAIRPVAQVLDDAASRLGISTALDPRSAT
jgi:hypothetical protein